MSGNVRSQWFILAAAAVLAVNARVFPGAARSDGAPAGLYHRLVDEYESRDKAAAKAYRAAKTEEERKWLFELRPNAEKYTEQVMALVRKEPKSDFAQEALLWVVRRGGDRAEAGEAIEMLWRDHLESKEIASVLPGLVGSKLPGAERWLRVAMEKSPHPEVQGVATFALARRLKTQAEAAEPKQADVDRLNREAAELLERVGREFGDVKGFGGTLADKAKNELYEILHLSIGMKAPEVEGEDLQGKRFRLSDYRGKVVMLDFWGHW